MKVFSIYGSCGTAIPLAGPPSPQSGGPVGGMVSGQLRSGAFVAENTIDVGPQYFQLTQLARGAIDRVAVQN